MELPDGIMVVAADMTASYQRILIAPVGSAASLVYFPTCSGINENGGHRQLKMAFLIVTVVWLDLMCQGSPLCGVTYVVHGFFFDESSSTPDVDCINELA